MGRAEAVIDRGGRILGNFKMNPKDVFCFGRGFKGFFLKVTL